MRFEFLYWVIVSVVFIYILNKYKYNSILVLFILFFFEGVFTYFGSLTWNAYKIILFAYSIYCLLKNYKSNSGNQKLNKPIIYFIIFIAFFSLSSLTNNDTILLYFNQFSKYFYSLISLLLIYSIYSAYRSLDGLDKLIKELLVLQIIFSVVNYFLMGIHEYTVGSISSNGGSAATVIPVLGIIWYWIYKKGEFKRNDWILIVGLLFIGFVSVKRAIWIIAPAFIFLLLYYVPQRRVSPKLLLLIPIAPIIFYLGVRLNPTFNEEKKVWGSFDFDYFYNYAVKYTFGEPELQNSFIVTSNEIAEGRGGATLLTFERIFNNNSKLSFLGNGLENMYAYNFNTVENPDSQIKISELNSVTMATGFFQNYYSGGILLIVSFWLYMLSLLRLIKNKRMYVVILIYFIWEYFLYANITLRTPATSFLFIFIIVQLSIQPNATSKALNRIP